jgi:predicted nucleic acid-binding protein
MIIDASIGVKWLVLEEDSDRAYALLAGAGPLYVPSLFFVEVANALWRKARKGEIDLAQIEDVASLSEVVICLDDVAYTKRSLEIAVELGHPVYDCLYLAVAEQQDDAVITADARFMRALAGTAFEHRVAGLATAC